ncbi:alpha/beta fold hydrolase [Kineococcus sp. TBRC 1896]|uniref:Alpha/beta fold hydrolase n=1 Tax=Kineococcus mangrovi TaxID=1660183 RepID=A0ABV4I1A3_9ACTN
MTEFIEGADGVRIAVDVHGAGTPLVLLHGFPQTRRMWRHVVADLSTDHTVVAADLRGYGESDAPPARDASGYREDVYSARTMARDVVAVADALDLGPLTVVGHDRGALVAFRAALDHPDRVAGLVCLDVVPTVDSWAVLHGVSAAVAFHLYLMAQPEGLPETLVEAAPREFFGHFLDAWAQDPSVLDDVREHYLQASSARVRSIVADFRASAGIDLAHDVADRDAGRTLPVPVGVLQQDWGPRLGHDLRAVWRSWAPDVDHRTTRAGHFLAEEAPGEVVALVRDVAARASGPGGPSRAQAGSRPEGGQARQIPCGVLDRT